MSIAGRVVLVVPCDARGHCDVDALATELGRADADVVWLSVDARLPGEDVVRTTDPGVVAATLTPVVDAVKRVDAAGVVLGTVDRSTLRHVRAPALVPVEVVRRAIDDGRPLLHAAVDLAAVVSLSSGER